ncbi:hypothetical protein PHYSODRAFT_306993 [Phytophthora sojae]|uniref:Uncharacterized protein n=1 Tax=Phytophthora sojae (strain P6497) TaxID=1094619 RepID=G5AC19_PHYSP|nr:hypothetical protein PHYSODRAFT_306993 [Phytophthora sojae]EGZ06894.1 hypothetical protein PHYSODRAFT_306993 [Phytophthora sojae]|eukprot:XP_009537658.1 hypothetical protein PHYSODRAFT_306993 [Phytophthora sojae]
MANAGQGSDAINEASHQDAVIFFIGSEICVHGLMHAFIYYARARIHLQVRPSATEAPKYPVIEIVFAPAANDRCVRAQRQCSAASASWYLPSTSQPRAQRQSASSVADALGAQSDNMLATQCHGEHCTVGNSLYSSSGSLRLLSSHAVRAEHIVAGCVTPEILRCS